MCALVIFDTVATHVALTDAHVVGKFTYSQLIPLKQRLGLVVGIVFSSACVQGNAEELILMMALQRGLLGSVAHSLLQA